ncbi:hypothetical protein ACLBWZ_10895 [Brucellaceae bacterium C25G]
MNLFNIRPFITPDTYTYHGKTMVWLGRLHRKGLLRSSQVSDPKDADFWKTESYNCYIGTSFAIGAFIFGLASVLMFFSLHCPALSNLTNLTFFTGSIPFTIAAALEHFQSANSVSPDKMGETPARARKIVLIGWQPFNAGWLSSATQLLGTIAFNISTFNAIAPTDINAINTLEIWAPNFEGSVLFLISGYLAFIEVGNRYWSWKPFNISWQNVFINLLGCIAFMISALLPESVEKHDIYWIWIYSNTYTLIGAICFFVSSLLLVKESKEAMLSESATVKK